MMTIHRKWIGVIVVLVLLWVSIPGWCTVDSKESEETIRIALLQIGPRVGDVQYNHRLIEAGIEKAAEVGADWVISPELAESGFEFVKEIGTGWIEPFPTFWVKKLILMAKKKEVCLAIGLPEKEAVKGTLYNSMVVIDKEGTLLGTYRKIKVVKQAEAEQWATPGDETRVFTLDGMKVGFLICADSYWPEIAARYQDKVDILLSGANWPPGECGPSGEWETRSKETGLSLIVCNRTGKERVMDFTKGESVVVKGGVRLYAFQTPDSTVFIVDWDPRNDTFLAQGNLNIDPLAVWKIR
ncbi:MAG: carbon-nitrogen hydrolase family protein [Candidatus Atribacteria bacterium]|nr:carbon-nitrogen hydrolase family protein [Candidatus Atribacteria bacterium]